ncbi:MAG: hypothetical protein AAF216_13715 [Pseudomonadota bacterium]
MTNEAQIEFWNGSAAEKWGHQAAQLDQMLSPFAAAILSRTAILAFAEKDRLSGLLKDAGWGDVEIDPLRTPLTMPGSDIDTNIDFMLKLGPLSGLLAEQDLDPGPIEAALAEYLAQNITAEGKIEMASACWMVRAAAPE